MRKVLIVGTISNAGNNFMVDLRALKKALSGFEVVKYFLVESDSTDSTIEILNKCKSENDNFDFISLGTPFSKNLTSQYLVLKFLKG